MTTSLQKIKTIPNHMGVQFLHTLLIFNFFVCVYIAIEANVQFKTLTLCEMWFCTILFFHGTVISATTS